MRTLHSALETIIHAIGSAEFPTVTAQAVGEVVGFDLSAVLLHRAAAPSRVLFDNFDRAGRKGLETYCRVTHAVNPMLDGVLPRAVRAKDYAQRRWNPSDAVKPYLAAAPEEELGFRSTGWPSGLEEVGLYFGAGEGVVEVGLYRERRREALSDDGFDRLQALCGPVAAAFGRQAALCQSQDGWKACLAPREAQIADLLLEGCSTEAIEIRLGLSRHTVKDYRKRIYRKLGVSSLAELFSLGTARQSPSRGIATTPVRQDKAGWS